jgi:spore germination protein YaaH
MKQRILFIGCAVFLLTGVARAEKAGPSWSSWVVYWDLAKSQESARGLAPALRDIGLFCYQLDETDHVIPGAPAIAGGIDDLRGAAPRSAIWLSVTNDRGTGAHKVLKDPAAVHTLLASPGTRGDHIAELLAAAAPADGLEIDYENLWAKDRAHFSLFIQELAAALHAKKKRLAVVVQAKTHDTVKDGAGAIDWPAVAASADEVKVMAYHYHYAGGHPGPIAPPGWVAELAKFALQSIPREKLGIVLTVDGFDWPRKGVAKSIDFPQAVQLAALQQVALKRDPDTRSPYFNYVDQGKPHAVWFEDAESLQKKIDTLQDIGITRIGFWRLAAGDPAFWRTLRLDHP